MIEASILKHMIWGLNQVIIKVQDSPKIEYNLIKYCDCILGSHYPTGYFGQCWDHVTHGLFGIVLHSNGNYLHSNQSKIDPYVFALNSLFTGKTAYKGQPCIVTKDDWILGAIGVREMLEEGLKNGYDNTDVSPYSNKSQQERLDELNSSVEYAKAALSTFSNNP